MNHYYSIKGLTLLLMYSALTSSLLAHSQSTTIATGEPIDFITVNDYTNPAILEVIAGFEFGMNMSFKNHNTLRNGIRGRPVVLHTGNNKGNSSLTYPILTNLLTTYPNTTAVVTLVGDDSIREAIRFVGDRPVGKEMVLLQPLSGAKEFYKFSPSVVTVISPRAGEVYSLIRHIVNTYQATRFAIITEVTEADNVEIAATVKKLVTSVGANVTYHYSLNYNIDPNGYNLASMSELLATKPHAVLILGGLNPSTAAALLAVMVSLPTAFMLCVMTILPLADQAFTQLPSPSIIGNRVIFTTYGPLYTDTSSALTNRFRSESAANPNTQYALSVLDAQPTMGTFVYFGWVMAEIIVSLTSKLIATDSASMQKYIFDQTIATVDDYIFGPFSGPCTGSRTLFCSCNTGSRILKLMRYNPTITLTTIDNSEFYVPVTSCDADTLVLESPLVVATVSPAGSAEAARIISDFFIGRNSALVTNDITADGTLVQELYTTNSTSTIQNLNIERLVTASAGSVLNVPVGDATGIGALIDPVEVRPRLYAGYRRDVVHVSPTYEQELHALASLAISKGKGITVLSAQQDDGSAVGATLTRSMNTLGKEGGGHRSASTIASGLLATGDGGVTILHGITTSADIAAIATHLGQQTNAVVAIPMAHLLVWYRELVAAVTDEGQRSRILFATSLPNWAGPVTGETTGPALQTYFDRVPATNRTPGSLRGFMTHKFITYVSSRVPNLKLTSEFLRMMYGVSVIVMDTGLVAGPYFDAACSSSSSSESCEMNIGARLIRVRSLAASTPTSNGTASGRDESFITLDSGIIAYKSIPGADNRLQDIIIIVSVVGGLLVLGGVLAVILVLCCSGRSNWTAPKDEKEPFTIIFTDIQSSTTLWAEVSEAMAPALDHHHALIRKLCSKYRGYEVKTIGDAFMVAFKNAIDAVDLSTSLQYDFYNDKTWSPQIDHAYLEMDLVSTQDMGLEERSMYSLALSQEDYGKVWNGLRVRIGIHTGFGEIKKDPVSHGYDYYGTVVNTAARTESIAHGGQVTLTEATLIACNLPNDRITAMGPVMLRGVPDPILMYQLHTIPNRIFPPLRVEKAQEEDDELGELTSRQSTKISDTGSVPLQSPIEGGGGGGGMSPRGHHNTTTTNSVALQKQYTRNVLSTAMVIMPPRAREKLLHDWCNKWRIQVPEITTTNSGGVSTAPSQDDIMLDALAAKLAPIMMQKSGGTITMIANNNNNNGLNTSNGSPYSGNLHGVSPRHTNNTHHHHFNSHQGLLGGEQYEEGGESVSSGMSDPQHLLRHMASDDMAADPHAVANVSPPAQI